ncbi:hypothetical protein NM2004085_2134 [Neisseria meningitidis 2004085]|nr:hypothetical protein NM2004085_2134 [Neisseria meningitidis 2004085]
MYHQVGNAVFPDKAGKCVERKQPVERVKACRENGRNFGKSPVHQFIIFIDGGKHCAVPKPQCF